MWKSFLYPLMLIASLALSACAPGTTLPTSTTTAPSPTLTPTPSPTLTLTPPPTPTRISTPSVDHLLVTDFQDCSSMFSVAPDGAPGNSLEFTCEHTPDAWGRSLRIKYTVPQAWAAFAIPLKGANFSPYDTLTFYARGDPAQGIPQEFKVELKRQDNTRLGVVYLYELDGQWKQFRIPLAEFMPYGETPPLCGWEAMSELVFTFEAGYAGEKGTLFLDDIYIERRVQGAPTPAPACQPTEPPPAPQILLISDFNACAYSPDRMGAAFNPSDRLTESYVAEAGRGCVARLDYRIQKWSAFFIKLQDVDLTPYTHLVFDVRADAPNLPGEIKIELKRDGNQEIAIQYLSGVATDWQTVTLSLENFRSPETEQPLSSLTGMSELVFTFEFDRSGSQGVVYLDNIAFTP